MHVHDAFVALTSGRTVSSSQQEKTAKSKLSGRQGCSKHLLQYQQARDPNANLRLDTSPTDGGIPYDSRQVADDITLLLS